jgi:hypothetical protein
VQKAYLGIESNTLCRSHTITEQQGVEKRQQGIHAIQGWATTPSIKTEGFSVLERHAIKHPKIGTSGIPFQSSDPVKILAYLKAGQGAAEATGTRLQRGNIFRALRLSGASQYYLASIADLASDDIPGD